MKYRNGRGSGTRLFLLVMTLALLLSGCGGDMPPGDRDNIGQEDASEILEPAESTELEREDPEVVESSDNIIGFDDLILYKDADATRLLAGTPREDIISAWGEPDMSYDPASDSFNYDEWMLLETYGITYVDVYYNHADGTLSEVCMRGTNGYVTADITEFKSGGSWKAGMERKYWDDLEAGVFEDWAAHAENGDDVLARLEGMTRNTVRELLGRPSGCYTDAEHNYLGDVFLVWAEADDDDAVQFVIVGYDGDFHVIPEDVRVFRCKDDAGEWLYWPEFEDGEVCADGVYNSVENPPKWPWDAPELPEGDVNSGTAPDEAVSPDEPDGNPGVTDE